MSGLVQFMGHPNAFMREVDDDTMEPTYRKRFSAVICVPVRRYLGEAVYLVDDRLFRAQKMGKYIRLTRDNSVYPDQIVHCETFATASLALVVADVKITNTILFTLPGTRRAA